MGGRGVYTLLSGLRDYAVDLTAIISMADSGGSNRILRDEFGILPTSDIRQALVALADEGKEREVFRRLFAYRFHQGVGISGMTLGNLFMAALTDIYGSQLKAIEESARILKVKGKILPVTLEDVQLLARYENDHQVVGEHAIDEPRHDGALRIAELSTIPQAQAYPEAVEAILAADLVVIGPGDLYTSLICNLIIKGIPEALADTSGKVVYVMNLMTRWGQTYDFTAQDHLNELNRYLGRGVLDVVLVNSNFDFPKSILVKYRQERACPVKDDLGEGEIQIVRRKLFSGREVPRIKGDRLKRSMIRHDSRALARAILELA